MPLARFHWARARIGWTALVSILLAGVVLAFAFGYRSSQDQLANNPSAHTPASHRSQGIPKIEGLITSIAYDGDRRQTVLVKVGAGCTSETWIWDGQAWTLKDSTSLALGCLASTAMGFDGERGQVVLFAHYHRLPGAGTSSGASTWIWDGRNWSPRQTSTIPMLYPVGLSFHHGIGQLVLVGRQEPDPRVQTWTWDGQDWHQVVVAQPPALITSIASDRETGSILAFGGGFTYETWSFDGKAWSNFSPQVAGPQGVFAMAADGSGHVFLLGGPRGHWKWNGRAWTRVTPSHRPGDPAMDRFGPFDRALYAAPDPGSGGVVLHGTFFYSSSPSGTETWVWDGVDWSRKACFMPTCGNAN